MLQNCCFRQVPLQSFSIPSASTEVLNYIDFIPPECTTPNKVSCISFHGDAYFEGTNEMSVISDCFSIAKRKNFSDLLAS